MVCELIFVTGIDPGRPAQLGLAGAVPEHAWIPIRLVTAPKPYLCKGRGQRHGNRSGHRVRGFTLVC